MIRTGARPARRRPGVLVAALTALALVATACNGGGEPETGATGATPTQTEAAGGPQEAEQLRFAVTASEQNLTPWTQGTGYPGYYMMTLVYDTLFWLDADGQPQPWLVEDHEISDDGTEYRMTLRDDVQFHDGEALTSEDVRFTIDYLNEHPRPRWTPTFGAIDSVETPDDTTVVITLSEPQAGFLRRPLADLPIIPEHIWSQVDDPTEVTEQLPVGSGPYEMVEYEAEQVWRFEANPDYFLGEPRVGELVMPFVADEQAAFAAVRSGEAAATSASLTPELVGDFEAAEGVEVIRGPGFRGWYLYINTAREPWGEVDLRRALLHAIDVNGIVETVLGGEATAGSPGFVHRDLPWANPETSDQTQDQDRARELLDGLGFEDSDGDGVREGPAGEPLTAEIIVDSDDPVATRAVEMISSAAGEVGLDLSPLALDPESAGGRIWPDEAVGEFQGDYTLGNHSWAAIVQLDFTFLRSFFHSDPEVGSLNRAAWDNPEYDELADEMVRTVDQQQRRDLLFQMQEILADEVPAIPLYFPDDLIPYRPEAFDGWQYYTGVGILNKDVFLPGS